MRLMIAAFAGVLLTGCATVGSMSLKDLPAEWPPVGTTKSQVQSRLGPPLSQSVMLQDGVQRETWGYHYASAEMNPLLFVPGLGLIVAASGEGISTDGTGLEIAFDANGKVVGRTLSKIHTGPNSVIPISAVQSNTTMHP
jgi:hypothetical protein